MEFRIGVLFNDGRHFLLSVQVHLECEVVHHTAWHDGMKGIDIDWEYPCSLARTDPVKITGEEFRTTTDAGGSCPADMDNLLLFLKELREALGDDMCISVASHAAEKNWVNMNLNEGSAYVDHWHP